MTGRGALATPRGVTLSSTVTTTTATNDETDGPGVARPLPLPLAVPTCYRTTIGTSMVNFYSGLSNGRPGRLSHAPERDP